MSDIETISEGQLKQEFSINSNKAWRFGKHSVTCPSKKYKLSEDLISKYSQKLDWTMISRYQILSEDFIQKNCHLVYWYNICTYQTLSEKFIEAFAHKLDWKAISQCQVLSEHFIEKHSDKLDWDNISGNQILSERFMEKYEDKIDWSFALLTQNVSDLFFNKHMDKISFDKVIQYSTRRKVTLYARNEVFSHKFASLGTKFLEKAIRNQNLSEQCLNLLTKKGKGVFSKISKYACFSRDFLLKNYKKIDTKVVLHENICVGDDVREEINLIEKLSV
jgi:hypothetical protein